MLPRTVAPAFVRQGPEYDITGERAVMLTDLLAILRRLRLLPEIWIARTRNRSVVAARYRGNALWVRSRISVLLVNNFVGPGL